MVEIRGIRTVFRSKPTTEGAGVRLKRVFGYNEVELMDPFLLLDHFGSDNPDDYLKGFPWHPHRGIETITYMIEGQVKHEDSLGNSGTIESGDVQWMTAGSGIIHQEMPNRTDGMMMGFQLWANLPSSDKMMHPRYQGIKESEIPEVVTESGARVRIICGKLDGTCGPVSEIVTDPEYLDVIVPLGAEFTHSVKRGHTVFAYVFEGKGYFDQDKERLIESDHLVLFEDGEQIVATAGEEQLRFLLVSGMPIGEPIAWYGPIVMNNKEELDEAFREYRNGTFIKHK
ncbi:MAG: pirin family protein [Candidatus Thorarchaeota archaeon]|nr:pirin family protein [Candidatus Thorarchaeota archaeon]